MVLSECPGCFYNSCPPIACDSNFLWIPFFNSLYTWPKLIAAAFILFVLSIIFDVIRTKRVITPFETALAAASLGLALMAHPGSAFSLAAFIAIVFYFRQLFTLRRAALAFIVLCTYVLPWSAYQKNCDSLCRLAPSGCPHQLCHLVPRYLRTT